MRQGPNPKRSRGRNNNNNNNNNNNGGRRPNMPLRMQTFDSNGPDVRIRGSAFQVHEKYLQLARDASSSGDRIIAESYLQHAEHYYRIIAAAQEQAAQQQGGDPNRRPRPEGGYNGQDYRGGQSEEEGGGEGADGFPSDEQIEGHAPRGDGYRQDGRQQDGRQQDGRQHEGRQNDGRQNDGRGQDGRQQQDPAYRPQPETQFRGDRNQDRGQDRSQQERNHSEGGNYRRQPEGEYRGDRDQQRQSPEGEGEQRQYSEDRPRVRTFDDRQGGGERGNGREDSRPPRREHVPINPMTPAQIEFPQPVIAEASAPVEDVPAAEAAPAPRRGRPRRVKVEAAAEPAEG
jgi:hypothetical protein